MDGEALGIFGAALADAYYKSVNKNQTWVAPTDHVTGTVIPTASTKGTPTRSESEKLTEHTNHLLQHQHNVRKHDTEKTKYNKQHAELTELRNMHDYNQN